MKNNKQKKMWGLLCLLALLSSCSRTSEVEKVPSNPAQSELKQSMNCYQNGDPPGDFCRASIIRIISDPLLYDRRNIIVYGYLAEVEGDYFLFANKDFYDSRDISSALVLVGTSSEKQSLSDFEGKNVTVFGVLGGEYPSLSVLLDPAGTIKVIRVRNGFNGGQ